MTSPASTHTSLPYRPAIDGLRAFAVLSVIAYHVLPASMPGGWFGVDVFFVISGFLITALLLSEYRRNRGRINLVAFWMARARRLLPALFLVLTAVIVAATFVTQPGRRTHVTGDVLATLGYVVNWRFVLGDEAYFGQIAAPSPVRHAWSLAVEEQFYILYPLLLVALLALISRRRSLAGALVALAGGSALLMVALHEPGLDPSRVYYGTDTRAHQLLVGAAVAAFISAGPGEVDRRYVRTLDVWCRRFSLPALLVVLSAFWWAGAVQDQLFEGGLVPLSVLICVVLVAATSPSSSLVQRILSWEPLRRVGLVSYGLYLWHWPIVVFLNDQVLDVPRPALALLQVTLTALLAYLSYRFVEKPVRRRGFRALLPRLPRLSMVVSLTTAPAIAVGALAMPSAANLVPFPTTDEQSVAVDDTAYRPGDEMTSVMLTGNSVPLSLLTYFQNSSHPDLRLIDDTNIGCDAIDATKLANGMAQPDRTDCFTWRDSLASRVAAAQPDVVLYFLAQTMVTDREVDGRAVAFGSAEWVTLVENSLDQVHAAAIGTHFAIVNLACHDMPSINSDEIARVNDTKYVKTLNETVRIWAVKRNVPILDQYSLLCPGDRFHNSINEIPLYDDSIHFTAESAPIFWRWLAPRVQQVARSEDLS